MKRSNIYKNNLKCLPEKLVEAIQNAEDHGSKIRGSEYPIIVSGSFRSGQTANMITAYDTFAQRFVEGYAERADEGAKRSIFMIGFLDGYMLESILRNNIPIEKVYVAVPDLDHMRLVLKERDMRTTLLNPKVVILFGTENYLLEKFSELCTVAEKNVDVFVHDKFEEYIEHTGLYPKMAECFFRLKMEQRFATDERAELMQNLKFNLPLAIEDKGMVELYGTKKGKIAFLVASGPSLDMTIKHILQERSEEIEIIAVGQATTKLRNFGLKPDYVVYCDFSNLAVNHFPPKYKEWGGDIPLIYCQDTYREVVAMHKNRYFGLDPKGRILTKEFRALKGSGTFDHAGSVATYALHAACKMGYESIWLFGVDLGYPGGNTHSRDYNKEGQEESYTDNDILTDYETMGMDGKMIKTSYFLDKDGEWMESYIHDLPITIVNMGMGRYLRGATNIFAGERL